MSLAKRVRAMNNGPVRMDRKAAEAAMARAVDKLGLKPLPIRWVKNYAELKKVDGWTPGQAMFDALPRQNTTLIDQRVYDFLNPRSWTGVAVTSATFSSPLFHGRHGVWASG